MLRKIETENYAVKIFFILIIIIGIVGIIITAFIDFMSVGSIINIVLFLIFIEINLSYNMEMEDYYEDKEKVEII